MWSNFLLFLTTGCRPARNAAAKGREREHDLDKGQVQAGHEARDQATTAPA